MITEHRDARYVKIVSVVSLLFASAIVVLGAMAYAEGRANSNVFFGVAAIFFTPGLTIAAIMGGALGFRSIHDPNFLLAGVLNFVIYFPLSFLALKAIRRSKKRRD